MIGISKKRLLVTFILSIVIVTLTGLIQVFDTEEWNFLLLGGTSCSGTGYPISTCINSVSTLFWFSISLINFLFWLLLINILYSLKQIKVALAAFGIWIVSMTLQMQGVFSQCLGKPSWYKITGYPIAQCVSKDEKVVIFAVYLINIAFWFAVIKLLQKAIKHVRI